MVWQVFTVSLRDDGYVEMRFRLANGTHRKLVSKGEILEVNFKLILMRVEVRGCCMRPSHLQPWVS